MSATQQTPIAIVGAGCRFPGGVDSPNALWRLAEEGRGTTGPVPGDRWDADALAALHDPRIAGRAAVGCFIDGDVWAWEPEALSVAPAERDWVDPQARVLMETAWEAVEHAGVPVDRLRGSRTGVYVGTYTVDNLYREARPVEDAPNSPYLFGNYPAGPAGRVAFSMDLRGPVMVVGTHCSSGMVALDTACSALTLGECDAALAGGVLLMLAPQTHYMEAPLLLSERGACHAFDSRADGYVRGEGAGMLLLKRLADAREDGDRVLAVIRGSAVNNDGRATRMTAPSTEMQQALFRDAIARARIDPGDVGLVEAHGPGTAVGDPVEYTSVDAVYGSGRGRCALGSVKTNIGHNEPVSGIAGVIKAVECLRRGAIPANRNFTEWNPAIVRDGTSRLFVPTALTDWPVPDAPRLAAVCSYGVSGTNGHVVLEAEPTRRPRRARKLAALQDAPEPRLFLLSANSPRSLASAAARLADWSEGDGARVPLGDVAHTLALRRGHAEQRLGLVARDRAELISRAREYATGEAVDSVVSGTPVLAPTDPGPVFVFTGQGSQQPGMCRGLLANEPVFAAAVDKLEPLIQRESGFSLRAMILDPDGVAGIERVQPALFGVQVALAALWRSWGVRPTAVIGQSLGEVAASVVAGALTPEAGVTVICRRAALLARVARGAMASVLLDAERTRAAIEAAGADEVSLAVLTSPSTTVISGNAQQIAALVDAWNDAGTPARTIDVDVASHSAQVDPIVDELHAALTKLPATRPTPTAFYSTVTDDPRDPGPLDAAYWVRNQRNTVHFQRAVEAALADGHRLFVECTPHPLAVRPIQETARAARAEDVVAIGSLRRGVEDRAAFLHHLAAAHTAGHEAIDFASRYRDGVLADLPTTAWNRTRHGGGHAPYALVAPDLPAARQHPLLGGHVHDPERPGLHFWQTPIGPRLLPWLDDHRVAGVPVLPGTGFAEMALAAGAEAFGTRDVALEDLTIDSPLVLDPAPLVTTRLTLEDGSARAEFLTRDDCGGVLVHARATVRDRTPHGPDTPVHSPGEDWTDTAPADLYRHLRERHDVFHGPAFTAVDRIRVHPDHDRAVASLHLADSARVSAAAMLLHPALTDELVQTVVAAWLKYCATSPGPVVVAGFDEIRVYGPTARARAAHVVLHRADDLACTASGVLTGPDGAVVAEVRGLRLANITPPEQRYADRLSHLAWTPETAPVAPAATEQRWLLVAPEDTAWATRLNLLLSKRTESSRTLVHPAGTALEPAQLDAALDHSSSAPATHVLLALDGPDTAPVPQAAHAAVTRTLTVLQRLAARETPPRLWVMWRGDHPLAAAGVRGLLRTASFEAPGLLPGALETSGATPLEVVLPDLLASRPEFSEISWRHGVRSVARVRPGPAPDTADSPPAPLRPDGSCLITGGLGGLGLLTARRLAERGARRVVLCGRSEPSADAARQLEDLRTATGTDVRVVLGDIAEPETARRAVDEATRDGLALTGVVHAAGVVEDATLARLDGPLLDRVWCGKAQGAWEVHRAVAGREPDFFVLYSSAASLIGSPGQGAYAAANAYLDALAEHRAAEGLPATAVHWGAWGQVGRGRHLGERGFVTISPQDGMDALEQILAEGHRRVAYSPIDVGLWTAPYPAMGSSALLADLLTGAPATQSTESPVRGKVFAARDTAERRLLLEEFITGQVRELLGGTSRHIGAHTSLVMLGLDSLGAVQLQQRLQRGLATEIKPGVIWVKPSAAGLADWLLDHMGFAEDDHAPKER
ncbi:type I polyketide synthase [Streptomyces sp. NPDC007117]|uniref:type I polyketide synthase n=1 Tax=Streptomyces sp. NPDC007117 TaxID=3154314 RepID=UPI0033D1C030